MEKTRSASSQTQFRYYDLVMAAFVTILLLSNLIGASKPSYVTLPFIGEWSFGAGVLFFPVSYVIGDVLTEVYGYAYARRCIWAGFAALLFMAFMSWVVVALPPAADWGNQAAYEAVFGQVPRIVLASIIAFWAGEFVNSYVLAKMKIWTRGKLLWTRTIGSTIFGQGVDSVLVAAETAGRDATVSDLVTPEITIAFVALALVAALATIVRKVWAPRET